MSHRYQNVKGVSFTQLIGDTKYVKKLHKTLILFFFFASIWLLSVFFKIRQNNVNKVVRRSWSLLQDRHTNIPTSPCK